MSFLGLLKYSAPFKISYIMKLMCSYNFTILNNIKHFITKYILRSFMHKFIHLFNFDSKYSKKVICRYYLKLEKSREKFNF